MKLWKYTLVLFLGLILSAQMMTAQEIRESQLKNVDGRIVKLDSFYQHKAVVLVFTSTHCVYSKKYEGRLMDLAQTYMPKGVAFLLINSNDPSIRQEDSFENMQAHAKEMGYTFPFLQDGDQAFAKLMHAEKNPEAFVIQPGETDFTVVFHGPIDDNPLLPSGVRESYLADFLDAILAGNVPESGETETRITGCNIRWSK